jgi:hypothetical protein
MGNRTGCYLFNDGREGYSDLRVQGLTYKDNRTLIDLYASMDISSKY